MTRKFTEGNHKLFFYIEKRGMFNDSLKQSTRLTKWTKEDMIYPYGISHAHLYLSKWKKTVPRKSTARIIL